MGNGSRRSRFEIYQMDAALEIEPDFIPLDMFCCPIHYLVPIDDRKTVYCVFSFFCCLWLRSVLCFIRYLFSVVEKNILAITSCILFVLIFIRTNYHFHSPSEDAHQMILILRFSSMIKWWPSWNFTLYLFWYLLWISFNCYVKFELIFIGIFCFIYIWLDTWIEEE